jgi:succinate dehydrogenase hydrophobic anchor subunit
VIRNRIFRVCTGLFVLSLIIILLGFTVVINEDFYNANQHTFWMETVAVESFSFAWLIKGEALFSDDTKHIAKNAIE